MSSFLSRFIRGLGTFKQASQAYKTGDESLAYGRDLTKNAVAGLDSLDADYQTRLAAGLPEDVKRAYSVQQGRISDTAGQNKAAFAANLVRRAGSGAAITPQAALDAEIENNANVGQSEFNSRNALAADEASSSLDYTSKILDAIERIRTTKVGAGFEQQNIGSTIYRSALDTMLRRRIAIAQTAASVYGGSQH